MSIPLATQGRATKTEKSAPGGAPDEPALAGRTPDAPDLEVLLATMLAKMTARFDAFCREHFTPAPALVGPSSLRVVGNLPFRVY